MPVGRLIVFLAIVGAVSVLLHIWLWKRLARDVTDRAWPRRWAAIGLAALALSVPAGLGASRVVPSGAGDALAWVGATWLGIMFFLTLWLGAAEFVRLGARIARRRRHHAAGVDLERRRLLTRSLAGVAAAGAGGMATAALLEAAQPPQVVEVTIPVRRLPPAFEGFRVVQLTDLHVGPLLRRRFVEELVRRTNALAPDLVAITGDLADGSVDLVGDDVAPLGDLRAPHGVWFTTGNHEYYVGVDEWLAHVASLGIRPLRNERAELRRGDVALTLAGIDDASAADFGGGHGADLDRALAGRDPSRPVLLLAHQPRQVADAARLGVDVQLSGHTHGGQIAPFGILVRLAQPAVAGLHRFGPTWLYVSRGAGFWGPPMRLGNPAEITLVRLVGASA